MIAQFASGEITEKENFLLVRFRKIYTPLLDYSLANRSVTITFATVLVALSILLSTKMGTEFIPRLDEGDMAIHALRITGTSLSQAVSMQDAVEKKINELPEVDYVFSKIGTADIASDPMAPSVADVFAIVKPRDQWPNPRLTKSDFVKKLEKKLAQVPGNKYEITQPIQMRFNELIAGTRSDVAVKVFGDDIDSLIASADEVEHVLASIPGAADVRMEQVTGLPVLTLKLKLDEYGSFRNRYF